MLPTFNRWELISRALASVLAGTGVRFEVLVVDDCGSDGTHERLSAIDDERLRVIRQETNQGVARARNRGIDEARGTWVAFLDDDDLWAPTKLRAQLDACAREGADFSYTGVVTISPALDRCRMTRPVPWEGVERTLLPMNWIGSPSSVMVRRDLLRQVGGFDPDFSILADWDLYLRVGAVGRGVACDEPLTGYLSHEASMHLDVPAALDEFQRLRAKHAALAASRGVALGSDGWWAWIAGALRRSGHPVRSAGLYLRLGIRFGNLGYLARAVAALAGDRATARVRALWPGGRDRLEDLPPEARWVVAASAGAVSPRGQRGAA